MLHKRPSRNLTSSFWSFRLFGPGLRGCERVDKHCSVNCAVFFWRRSSASFLFLSRARWVAYLMWRAPAVRQRDVMGKMRRRRKFFKLFSCLGRSQTDDVVPDDGISCSASSPAVAAASGCAADELVTVTKADAVASCPHNMFRYTWSPKGGSHHAPVSWLDACQFSGSSRVGVAVSYDFA